MSTEPNPAASGLGPASSLHLVSDDSLIPLVRSAELPATIVRTLERHTQHLLENPYLAIRRWEHFERPELLLLEPNGTLTALVAADADMATLGQRIETIDAWLAEQSLRTLGTFTEDPLAFYESLWDISPDEALSLRGRRFVVVSAGDSIDVSDLRESGFEIDTHTIDVFSCNGVTVMAMDTSLPDTKGPASIDLAAPIAPLGQADEDSLVPEEVPAGEDTDEFDEFIGESESANLADEELTNSDDLPVQETDSQADGEAAIDETIDLPVDNAVEETSVEDTDIAEVDATTDKKSSAKAVAPAAAAALATSGDGGDEETVIDLTDDAQSENVEPKSVLQPEPSIRQGGVFETDRLPLLFDPLVADLESISDVLFAVGHHLVIVEALPEKRRSSPFEDRAQFRWDTDPKTLELVESYRSHPDGSLRTVHLFMESAKREESQSLYIGRLRRISFENRSSNSTSWFAIEPPLDLELYRSLRRGKFPAPRATEVAET